METDNSEAMILHNSHTDSIDDKKSSAVRKKYKKRQSQRRTKGRGRVKDNGILQGDLLSTNGKDKKLNGRLKRLFAKKERMRSASESLEYMKVVEDGETNSTDSGIDMTDMMKNFDDHISKSNESESCAQCGTASGSKGWKRKRSREDHYSHNANKKQCIGHNSSQNSLPLGKFDKSRIVAMDCEFVGVGARKVSALGRCSIVTYDGKVLCDVYAQPEEPITDYRTPWSGIRKKDMAKAVPFSHAQNHIRRILQDKIIVGHALHCDFNVLGIYPPAQLVRDTSKYIPLHKLLEEKLGVKSRNRYSLKRFSKHLLGRDIQRREHCSVEDSVAALDLYKVMEDRWEADVVTHASLGKASSSDSDQGNSHSYFEDSYWPDNLLDENLD